MDRDDQAKHAERILGEPLLKLALQGLREEFALELEKLTLNGSKERQDEVLEAVRGLQAVGRFELMLRRKILAPKLAALAKGPGGQ